MTGHHTADLSNIVAKLRQQEETARKWDNHKTTSFEVQGSCLQARQGEQTRNFLLPTR